MTAAAEIAKRIAAEASAIGARRPSYCNKPDGVTSFTPRLFLETVLAAAGCTPDDLQPVDAPQVGDVGYSATADGWCVLTGEHMAEPWGVMSVRARPVGAGYVGARSIRWYRAVRADAVAAHVRRAAEGGPLAGLLAEAA